MNEADRLDEISKRLESNQYFVNPLSDVNVKEDIEFLVSRIKEKDEKISKLERKNEVLLTQVMDLTQEIENVKSDFGNQGR